MTQWASVLNLKSHPTPVAQPFPDPLVGEKGDTGERKLDSHGHNDFERNQVGYE